MKVYFISPKSSIFFILCMSFSLVVFNKSWAMGTQYPSPGVTPPSKFSREQSNPLLDVIKRGNFKEIEDYFKNNLRKAVEFVDVAIDGITPLMAAIDQDAPDILALLLLNHANLMARDTEGKTPLEYAKAKNKPHTAGVLTLLLNPDLPDRIGFLNQLVEIGRGHASTTTSPSQAIQTAHQPQIPEQYYTQHYNYPPQQEQYYLQHQQSHQVPHQALHQAPSNYPNYLAMGYQQPEQGMPPIDPFAYMPPHQSGHGYPH